jgi:predicted Zn-dependent protease
LYFLAQGWQRRATYGESGRLRTTNVSYYSGKASALYEQLLKQQPQFPLRVEVRYQLAKERLRAGKRKAALAEIDELVQEHADLELLQRARRAIRGLQEAGVKVTDPAMAANLP